LLRLTGGRRPPRCTRDQAVEEQRRRVRGDLVRRAATVAVPLDRPVDRAEGQHADHREIEPGPERAGRGGVFEEPAPVVAVLALALEVPLADRVGHLSQDAEIRRRVGVLREHDAEMRRDRRPEARVRVGADAERVDGLARRRKGGVDAGREHRAHQVFLGVEVVVQASRLHLRARRDVLQRDRRVAVAAEEPGRGVEHALAGHVGLRRLGHLSNVYSASRPAVNAVAMALDCIF
jgi:hypothetical protein